MKDNKLSSLVPEMQKRVNALMNDPKRLLCLPCLVIFETRRTEQRQAQLYGLGRSWNSMMWAYPTKPAYWKYSQSNATKRTWTIHSKHLKGEACDFAFEINGKITWDVGQEDWNRLVELGKKYGLKSLAPREYAHLELEFPLTPLKMPEKEFVIPEWAADSCRKAKEKGIITKSFNENITAYRLCVILDKLNLLK